MIKGFADETTQALYQGLRPAGFPAKVAKAATRKLSAIHYARKLSDLRTPAGNRLHSLKGDRQGQHAIRVNKKYRICFTWNPEDGSASNVEVVDYH